jgi:DNA-binding GntR family transcriptional regulator
MVMFYVRSSSMNVSIILYLIDFANIFNYIEVVTGKSLTDKAHELLKQQVISCELKPGAYYTEAGLAAELSLGLTPIREALARLAQQGWVRSVKGRGYEILPLTLGGVRELFGARTVVEPAAIEQAAGRLDSPTASRLLELCKVRYRQDDINSRGKYLQANREIHMTLVSGCGNRILIDMVLHLLERSERLMHLGMVMTNLNQRVSEDHEYMVRAVIEGDGSAARKLAVKHIKAGEQAAIEALLATPAMQEAQIGLGGYDPVHQAAD